MPSVSPSNALSPRVMLASAIHAQPGVYALLVGSGVSRSAGIPTGWEIVQDLVHKAAVADDPDNDESHALAAADPEAWWEQHGEGELGYSSLLAKLASTPAARQSLLATYFVASEKDREAGLKEPTAAHKAIAELVNAGWIKVIITTNFDRLIEQALDAAGVPYQVVSRAEAVKAMTPLAHARATVIKLHGDWTDLESRNTFGELDRYPKPWRDLLTRIFNEDGLLISGWSAEWDKALVRVLESTPRRYPLYWDSGSSKKSDAKNLLSQLGGHVIEADSADNLFDSLAKSIDALQKLAEPPLTTAVAVARLKRALPDPLRRIELHDLIRSKTQLLLEVLAQTPDGASDLVQLDELFDQLFEASKPLITLLIHGVRYDDGTHTRLWTETLESLMDARHRLQHYPALLALRAMSIEAVRRGQEDVLIELLKSSRWRNPLNRYKATPAAHALHMSRVIDANNVNRLPRWNGATSAFPPSHLLKAVLHDLFVEYGVDVDRYEMLCDDVEYRTGLIQHLLPREQGDMMANPGEFIIEWEYVGHVGRGWDEAPVAERRFREDFEAGGEAAWSKVLGEQRLDDVLANYRDLLVKYKRA